MIANRPEKPERPELTEDLKKEVQDLHAKEKKCMKPKKNYIKTSRTLL